MLFIIPPILRTHVSLINASLNLKLIEFGEAGCFIWSPFASNDYAISTHDYKLKLFKNFNLKN